MGGGTRYGDDQPRRGDVNPLSEMATVQSVVEGSGGALASADEFCAREHQVPFRIAGPKAPAVGEAISLLAGNPVTVVRAGESIGFVDASAAGPMNGCLGLDWRMHGSIISVDAGTGKGVARVAGIH